MQFALTMYQFKSAIVASVVLGLPFANTAAVLNHYQAHVMIVC